ncbi:MAG: 23S rRNA (pseudouridine(1915)-N(3))-methyltransferase RlmH [Oscillospiraceae bacterium]|jgi:23S rRNA (pseudouridine1915-N3)-methyltransferase|nr:23S rRNA (pseudouridine(1915)-N(3))-methyltransferase RlmH [Oscillospiraceae bacterium]
MVHIELLCVGRLKEPYFEAACRAYEKRLTPHARLRVTQLPEGHPVADRLPAGAYTTALCIDGESVGSEALAARLQALMTAGRSSFCFLIGGSDGLPDAAVRRADWRLSLSRMTFPHHLARVLLLEQLYRAFQIMSGGSYHK